MMTQQDIDDDTQAVICQREHDSAPDPECSHCTGYRATIQRCAYCDNVFEDGAWWDDPLLRNPCRHEPTNLMDDWWRSLHCEAHDMAPDIFTDGLGRRFESRKRVRCQSPVAAPGEFKCRFHGARAVHSVQS